MDYCCFCHQGLTGTDLASQQAYQKKNPFHHHYYFSVERLAESMGDLQVEGFQWITSADKLSLPANLLPSYLLLILNLQHNSSLKGLSSSKQPHLHHPKIERHTISKSKDDDISSPSFDSITSTCKIRGKTVSNYSK